MFSGCLDITLKTLTLLFNFVHFLHADFQPRQAN